MRESAAGAYRQVASRRTPPVPNGHGGVGYRIPESSQAGRLATPAGQEAPAGDPLGGAAAVQVRRDAAQVERPAGAEDHAQVDVLRLGDDALVEHEPDLLRPARRAPASRTCSAVSGAVADLEQLGHLGVDLVVDHQRQAGVDDLARGSR